MERLKLWYIKRLKTIKGRPAHIAIKCILEDAIINVSICLDCDTQCVEYNKLKDNGIIKEQ